MNNLSDTPINSIEEDLLIHLTREEIQELNQGELSFSVSELHSIFLIPDGPRKLEILSKYHEHFRVLGYDKEDIIGIISSKYLERVTPLLLKNTEFMVAGGLTHEYLVSLTQRFGSIKELKIRSLQYQQQASSTSVGQKRKSTPEKNKLYQELKELGYGHQMIKRFASRARALALFVALKSHTAFLVEKGFSLNKIAAYAKTPDADFFFNNLVGLLQLEISKDISISLFDKCFDYATGYEQLAKMTRLLQTANPEDSNVLIQSFNQLSQYHDTLKCLTIFINLFERGFTLHFLSTITNNRSNTLLMFKLNDDLGALERLNFSREEITHYYSSPKSSKSLFKMLLCYDKLRHFRASEPLIAKLKFFREIEIGLLKSFLDTVSCRSSLNLIQMLENETTNPESFLHKLSPESRQSILAILPVKVSIVQNSLFTTKTSTEDDEAYLLDSFELFKDFPGVSD